MPVRCVFVIVAFAFALPISAQIRTVPFVDTSDPGSPLQTTGSVTFWETIESSSRCAIAHATRCAVGERSKDLIIKNVSDMPILAFVVSGVVRTPAGMGAQFTQQYEGLFSQSSLEPGETDSWPADGSGIEVGSSQNDQAPDGTVRAEVRTVFVQFQNGATFGDENAARDLFRMRERDLQILTLLGRIYDIQGEEPFARALEKAAADHMAPELLDILVGFQKTLGSTEAIARIRSRLERATERLGYMKASSSY